MKRKNMLKAVIVVAVALAFLMPGSTAITNEENGSGNNRADTIVSISPSTQDMGIGETFTVDVSVEPGEPIIGMNVGSLSFNPDLIQVNSVTEGDLFEGITTFFIPGAIDNIAGTITFIGVITLPATGVTDPGTFCTISFTAQNIHHYGISVLDLEDIDAADTGGNPVSIVANDGEVIVGENDPPNKPDRPSGPKLGKANIPYTFTTQTQDPEGDQVYYMWDFGDGTTSGWLGPYDSGEESSAVHTWTSMGRYYAKVKAKDIFDFEGPWSKKRGIMILPDVVPQKVVEDDSGPVPP